MKQINSDLALFIREELHGKPAKRGYPAKTWKLYGRKSGEGRIGKTVSAHVQKT